MDTIPDTLQCEACLQWRESKAFRRDLASQARREKSGCGKYIVREVCKTCQRNRARNTLPADAKARYDEITARNMKAQRANQKQSGLDMVARNRQRGEAMVKKMVETLKRKGKTLAPYDQAVEELEKEWGVPVAQWTLKQDAACTLRMYDILGWPRDSFLRGRTANVSRDNYGAFHGG
jgi:hypothetical protein